MDQDQRPEPKFHKSAKKRPLNLDCDGPPAELVVRPMASDHSSAAADCLESMSDHKLMESILSKKTTLEKYGRNLKDGAAKIIATINRWEAELARRRKTKPLRKEVAVDDDDGDDDDKPRHATGSSDVDVSTDSRQENISSQARFHSSFASCFVKKIEDDTDCTTVEAFSKEMPDFKHCKTRGKRLRSSSRKLQFQCPSELSGRDRFKEDNSCRATSTFSRQNSGKTPSRRFAKMKDTAQAIHSDGSRSRKGQPIVLDGDDDADEPCVLENTQKENKLAECMKEARIYYPSRDDPHCVEICYSDIDCLAAEGYLTSTIMNFYIRYLKQQASLMNRSLFDYHFFNTYFYKKLQVAVSCKRTERESFFVKFRRWWKGVNIFQKAYILIPIHEDLHWSLIIICIPDKEDESGPIILHLDSLGLHSSRLLFVNIKSYLIEEKNYLDREGMSSDVSMTDRIWKCLRRRIETEVIKVPQQKNEYDCGLFVLYFIERFIEDAPERLKKKDLAMFGKEWFKPEEASSLRKKIRKLLVAELQSTISHNSSSESSHSSSAGGATECFETAKDSLI